MGKRRDVSKMLTVSDGYWGFINQKRFYRWAYASLTFFAIFAVVVAFFDVGAGTSYSVSARFEKYTTGEIDENERLLQWIYIFYPTPMMFAWFLVYFAKFLFCYKIKRLRKARNYKYNLLLASLLAAVFYAIVLKGVLRMTLYTGAKFRGALIIAICELGLISIEVFDERKSRKERHRRKRMLQEQQWEEEQGPYEQKESVTAHSPVPSIPVGGML